MKSKIWTIPLRIFHWCLAAGFTITYILGDADQYMNYHYATGLFVGTLLIFRIIFGLIGPKYSHFRDFPLGKIVRFPIDFFSKEKYDPGHNPLSSLVFLAIFLTGIICSFSGYLLYAGPDNILGIPAGGESFEEFHEALANIFLGLVIVHLAGLMADAIFHGKYRTITAMFTGKKNLEAENARLNWFQKIFAVLWIIIPLIIFYRAQNLPVKGDSDNEKTKTEQFEEEEDD